MIISQGIPDEQLDRAAALYWQAFGAKLGRVLSPEVKALAFIHRVLRPDHAISAIDESGALIGVAGFKTSEGALVGGDLYDLRAVFGSVSGTIRGLILHLLERDIENERFLMDGIFVAKEARGKGVGTALLSAIIKEAAGRGYKEVRLDVIDTNPRAKALYERQGFIALKTQTLGPLRYIFGFRSATTMVRKTEMA